MGAQAGVITQTRTRLQASVHITQVLADMAASSPMATPTCSESGCRWTAWKVLGADVDRSSPDKALVEAGLTMEMGWAVPPVHKPVDNVLKSQRVTWVWGYTEHAMPQS